MEVIFECPHCRCYVRIDREYIEDGFVICPVCETDVEIKED